MTAKPFTGSPTPVFILDHLDQWLPVETMQLLARYTTPPFYLPSPSLSPTASHPTSLPIHLTFLLLLPPPIAKSPSTTES